MSLGLYAFWKDELDDVVCVYRWISGNVDQIVKDGNFFKVGLVICLFLGFLDHLYSDKLIVFDQLIELIIF